MTINRGLAKQARKPQNFAHQVTKRPTDHHTSGKDDKYNFDQTPQQMVKIFSHCWSQIRSWRALGFSCRRSRSIYQMNCYLPRYRTTTINASLKVFVCRNTFFRSRCSCLPHSLTFCHTRGKALFSIVLPIHTPCSASNELWNTFFKGAHSCWFLISCKQ